MYTNIWILNFHFQIPYATRVISQATGSSIPTYDATTTAAATNDLRDRLCGRIFAADEDKDALEIYGSTVSVCCKFNSKKGIGIDKGVISTTIFFLTCLQLVKQCYCNL